MGLQCAATGKAEAALGGRGGDVGVRGPHRASAGCSGGGGGTQPLTPGIRAPPRKLLLAAPGSRAYEDGTLQYFHHLTRGRSRDARERMDSWRRRVDGTRGAEDSARPPPPTPLCSVGGHVSGVQRPGCLLSEKLNPLPATDAGPTRRPRGGRRARARGSSALTERGRDPPRSLWPEHRVFHPRPHYTKREDRLSPISRRCAAQ